MKKFVFSEVGFGNKSFFSTEIEEGKNEIRIESFIWPKKVIGVYLRIWVGRSNFILSSCDGFVFKKKNRKKIKFLFGVQGVGL
jgi:hypothetical protein